MTTYLSKLALSIAMFLLALLATLYAVPSYAATVNPWYLGISGDVTWLRDSDTGGGGNVALGYRFPASTTGDFRLEGEAGYHGVSGTHYFSYMGNLYYDFTNLFSPSSSGLNINPYIGGGLGDAAIHFGDSSFANTFHHHDNEFAYEGMAGLNFISASAPNTEWSLGYRYLGTDNHNIHANNLELGVRFHF